MEELLAQMVVYLLESTGQCNVDNQEYRKETSPHAISL